MSVNLFNFFQIHYCVEYSVITALLYACLLFSIFTLLYSLSKCSCIPGKFISTNMLEADIINLNIYSFYSTFVASLWTFIFFFIQYYWRYVTQFYLLFYIFRMLVDFLKGLKIYVIVENTTKYLHNFMLEFPLMD